MNFFEDYFSVVATDEDLLRLKGMSGFSKCISDVDGVQSVVSHTEEHDGETYIVFTPIDATFFALFCSYSINDLTDENFKAIFNSMPFLTKNYLNQ